MNSLKKIIPPLLCLTAAMIWGFAFTAQKGAALLDAFTVGSLRNIFATLFLLAVIPLFDKMRAKATGEEKRKKFFTKNELVGGTVCGVILTAASAFQQTGLQDGTDAGKAAFITALYVVLVPVISLALGKRTAVSVWISVFVAAIGFYLLCIKGDFSLTPSDTLVLICALIFALHIIAIDRFSPSSDGVRLSCVQFFVSFLLNSILMLIFELPISLAALGEALPSLLYIGVCSSGIAYTLQILAQKDINPAACSVILSLESVFGVIGGAIFIGERMTEREYLGCAIVFFAVILSQIDFGAVKTYFSKNKENL